MKTRRPGGRQRALPFLVCALILGFGSAPTPAQQPTGGVVSQAEAVAKVRWTGQPGPQSEEEGRIRRNYWQIPSPVAGQVPLKATAYRPKGPGPYPLAVILHGGSNDAAVRHAWPLPHFFQLAVMLVDRGYFVIVPQRRNYGDDPNPFAEQNGDCGAADFRKALAAAADDGAATIAYMRQQTFIDQTRLLLAGHSAGGVSALALAARNPTGLVGIINFAGAKGAIPAGNWRKNCGPTHLVSVIGEYGAKTTVPSLWIYAENDLWAPPEFATLLHTAYGKGAPGKARLLITAPFGADGHVLAVQREAAEIWSRDVGAFVDGLKPL